MTEIVFQNLHVNKTQLALVDSQQSELPVKFPVHQLQLEVCVVVEAVHVLHPEGSQVVEVAREVDQTPGYQGAEVVALSDHGGGIMTEEYRDFVLLEVTDNLVENLLLLLAELTNKVERIIQPQLQGGIHGHHVELLAPGPEPLVVGLELSLPPHHRVGGEVVLPAGPGEDVEVVVVTPEVQPGLLLHTTELQTHR